MQNNAKDTRAMRKSYDFSKGKRGVFYKRMFGKMKWKHLRHLPFTLGRIGNFTIIISQLADEYIWTIGFMGQTVGRGKAKLEINAMSDSVAWVNRELIKIEKVLR